MPSSTYKTVVGKSDERFHGMYFIINDSSSRLACVIEYVTAQIDMRTRRMASFAEQLSAGLDSLYKKHQSLAY